MQGSPCLAAGRGRSHSTESARPAARPAATPPGAGQAHASESRCSQCPYKRPISGGGAADPIATGQRGPTAPGLNRAAWRPTFPKLAARPDVCAAPCGAVAPAAMEAGVLEGNSPGSTRAQAPIPHIRPPRYSLLTPGGYWGRAEAALGRSGNYATDLMRARHRHIAGATRGGRPSACAPPPRAYDVGLSPAASRHPRLSENIKNR